MDPTITNLVSIIVSMCALICVIWFLQHQHANVQEQYTTAPRRQYECDMALAHYNDTCENTPDRSIRGNLRVDQNIVGAAIKVGNADIAHPDDSDGAIYRSEGQLQIAADDLVRFRHTGSRQTGIQMDLRQGSGDIKGPSGFTKITRQGIMFGGPNDGSKEVNSAQISAGLHVPNSLNIVGMSANHDHKTRKINMWAEGGATVYGPMDVHSHVSADHVNVHNGVHLTRNDPGPMIEKKYGNNNGDRYGVGQYPNGVMRLYSAESHRPATVALSFAKPGAGHDFDDKIVVSKTDTTVNGPMNVRGGYHHDIKGPSGFTKITGQGIMFGGPNDGSKEVNSAQISAGLHVPNSLNIVGMSANHDHKTRKINMWAEGGATVYGPMDVHGPVNVHDGVHLARHDPGPMIEKKYGNNNGDRYGVGQYPNGVMRLYSAQSYRPATVALSFAKPGAGHDFDDKIVVSKTETTVNGPLKVNGKLCIEDVCIDKNQLRNLN